MALTVRIKKRYGDFLLDVDFSAESGACLALLGASGCGKSTALKCVAGIHRPDWGRVALDGTVLFDSQRGIDLPPQRRRVGYLFQQYALFPHMTAEQNIAACLGHLKRGERRARLEELTALLHLEGLGKLRPRQLSGGQQQRVALARMLAAQPAAILLDEPLSALDSSLRWQLEWELRKVLSRFGGPVVWVSHDREEIFRSCRRVCVLDRGRSAPAVSAEELLRNPGTVSAARLSGCRNCVPAVPGSAPGSVAVPAWGLVLRSAAPWRAGVSALGIHACHVRPGREGEVNAFLCETLEEVEGVSTVLAALRPVGAPEGAPPLWMELERGAWAELPERFWAAVDPDRLLLLE